MGGLAKGLAIIESLASHEGQLTIAEAAHVTGATRASARRCLLTLTELGYLEFDGKFYRPQPRLIRLSASYSMSRPLPQLAQPILAQARDALNESISLGVLDGEHVQFVGRAEAARLVSARVSLGTRAPAHALAVGRVLLGAWSDEKLRAYLRQVKPEATTKKSLTGKTQLFDAVRKAQELGYALLDEELEIGLRAIAVPVTDSHGLLIAAIGASTSAARFTASQMIKEFIPILREHAAKLGRGL
ncbi:MAG TPA: IclR family transcriptional regulator C-terminal domain-containing protein [Pseudolabrys sp.]|nr:IclR family transcriptional regulator C-terminal domain-containing protein [Pseudolabrys sp.]